jgi:anti-sigma regulatory factor (Ser/Thr protein kinase)
VTLVIGDVQGHSFSAAAVMGRVSTALHAYLLEGHALDVALRRVNPMVEQSGLLVTCCLMSLDPATGEVRTARAGHPLPLFWRPDSGGGEMSPEGGGPPLGVSPEDAEWSVTTGRAQDGDRLVLFTDGLVERSGVDTDERVRAIIAVLDEGASAGPETLADMVLGTRPPGSGDDVALIVADFVAEPQHSPVSMTVSSYEAVADARRFTGAYLSQWGLHGVQESAILLVSELVTNALLHAGGPARLELRPKADRVRICVSDDAPVEPTPQHPDDESDHGRGLMLVDMLAREWGVVPAGLGKTVWAEVAAE